MQERDRIAAELKKAFDGNAWHGPALTETLSGVSARDASARPVGNAHTIWEIVLHIAAWENVVRSRVKGRALAEPAEGDWPDVAGEDEQSWQLARERLSRAQSDLLATIAKLDDAQLDELAPGTDRTLYETLHGVVQHNLYHAGQIAVLRKALSKT
jgi:uncharacterized damage-inducible protein DinB